MLKKLKLLLKRVFLIEDDFLCDTCRYDYRDACKHPERPNATQCRDYKRR